MTPCSYRSRAGSGCGLRHGPEPPGLRRCPVRFQDQPVHRRQPAHLHRGRSRWREGAGADEPPPPSPCTRGTRVQGLALGTGQSVTLAPPSSLYVRLAVVEALTGVPESTLRDAR